jgi:hypothetical protein
MHLMARGAQESCTVAVTHEQEKLAQHVHLCETLQILSLQCRAMWCHWHLRAELLSLSKAAYSNLM